MSASDGGGGGERACRARPEPSRAWLGAAFTLLLALAAAVALPAVSAGAEAASRTATTTPGRLAAGPAPGVLMGKVTNFGFGVSAPKGIVTGADGNLWFANPGPADAQSSSIGRSTPAGDITVFPLSGLLQPGRLTAGPDGNVWFTAIGAIGRISPAGVVTAFRDPLISAPSDITTGSDGALWFTDQEHASIGRLTPAGQVTAFTGPGIVAPQSIVTAPDGTFWFANAPAGGSATVGHMTTAGAVTTVDLPSGGYAGALAIGPGGGLWYTSAEPAAIGRVSLTGVVTTFPVGFGRPTAIASGADGNLWFGTVSGYQPVGRITTSGVITDFDGAVPALYSDVVAMTKGPDGNIWFTRAKDSIDRIDPSGAAEQFRGNHVSRPGKIVAGRNGDLWFTNERVPAIGRITTDGALSHRTFPGSSGGNVEDIAMAADGAVSFAANGTLYRLPPDGSAPVTTGGRPFRSIAIGAFDLLWFGANYDFPPTQSTLGFLSGSSVLRLMAGPDIQAARLLTAGPDDTMWFVSGNTIGRAMLNGMHSAFPAPVAHDITGLVAGPDGAMWFAAAVDHTIGRITGAGEVSLFSTGALAPNQLGAGPDGNVWFTTSKGSVVGRITPQGDVASLTDPTIDDPQGITTGPDGALWFTNRANNSVGRIAIPPAPPTSVVAAAGTTAAVVSWDPSALPSADPVTLYTATASPGGASCTWTAGPTSCVVRGLVPGVPYTFAVSATNVVGTSGASPPSNEVTPGRGAGYHPIPPARVLDSRSSLGSWAAPLTADPRDLQVAGTASAGVVPEGAAAVVMNVTATGGTAGSFVTIWPAGGPRPTSSSLNFGAGETIANLVTARIGSGGRVTFANAQGAVDIVADVVGYYDDGIGAGDLFTGMTPTRLLDSRTDVGGWHRQLTAGTPRDLLVRQPTNLAGVPATASAVVANITVTGATAPSFLTVGPSGAAMPSGSTVNFAAGQTVPNLSIVKIGPDGAIRLANAAGAADVVVDLVGWFEAGTGSRFHAIEPTRVLDDRNGTGLAGPWGAAQSRTLVIAGAAGSSIPPGANGLVANLTATAATAGSFVTVYPHGAPRPTSSNLNFGAGQTVPNQVMVKVGDAGSIDLFNAAGSVDLVLDAVGYFSPT